MVWVWKSKFRYFFQPLAPEVAIFTKKSVSGPQSALFGPKGQLPGPPRKSLYKHKVLGGVLEARNRESALFTKKVRNSARKHECHQKVRFGNKKSTFRATAGNVPKRYLFSFRNMLLINDDGSFLAPGPPPPGCRKAMKSPKYIYISPNFMKWLNHAKSHEHSSIWLNFKNFIKFLNFRESSWNEEN